MSGLTRQCLAAVVAIATATACSPSLNWRTVSLHGLETMLPCKPDHGERTVQLGTQDVLLRMSGCEAAGALYAVGHVRVADTAQVEPTKSAWRQATLSAMQATAGTAPPAPTGNTPSALPMAASTPEQWDGKRPDGSPVQAQFAWLTKGQDLYQVAVYASKLDQEKTELLFSELRLP